MIPESENCSQEIKDAKRVMENEAKAIHLCSQRLNEQIVDAWFKTIARQVLEEGGEDPERGAGFIDTTKIDEDKTKVS